MFTLAVSFFDLPLEIRKRIYAYAGILRACPISIAEESSRLRQKEDHNGCCRRRSNDCTALSRRGPRPAFPRPGEESRRVCRATRVPVALLRVSKAFHEEGACLLYGENRFSINGSWKSCLNGLLDLGRRNLARLRSLQIALDWPNFMDGERAMIERVLALAKAIPPGQLAFTFVTDLHLLEDLPQIASPLTALPPLRSCAVSFMHANTSTAAAELAQGLLHQNERRLASFPFERLPKELQVIVFEYCVLPRTVICNGHFSRLCCRRCTDSLEICCCITKGAYSSTCVCFPPPVTLLRLNRSLSETACRVLFSQNLFVLRGGLRSMISFLSNLPSAEASQLRRLQIVLERHNYPETVITKMWEQLVSMIETRLQLASLELHVDLADSISEHLPPVPPIDILRQRLEYILAALKKLPLKPRKLFVYLDGYPEMAREAEKSVMGESYLPVEQYRLYTSA